MTIVSKLLKGGKKMVDEVGKVVSDQIKLDKLLDVDIPSPKQLKEIKKLKENIKKQRQLDRKEEMLDRAKKSGSRKGMTGKALDDSMAGPLNRGGMTMRKGNMAYKKGGSAAKPRTGSMDYRKGGMISSTKSKK